MGRRQSRKPESEGHGLYRLYLRLLRGRWPAEGRMRIGRAWFPRLGFVLFRLEIIRSFGIPLRGVLVPGLGSERACERACRCGVWKCLLTRWHVIQFLGWESTCMWGGSVRGRGHWLVMPQGRYYYTRARVRAGAEESQGNGGGSTDGPNMSQPHTHTHTLPIRRNSGARDVDPSLHVKCDTEAPDARAPAAPEAALGYMQAICRQEGTRVGPRVGRCLGDPAQ